MALDLETIFGDIRDRLLAIAQLGVTTMQARDYGADPLGNLPAWEITIDAASVDINGNVTIEAAAILHVAKFTESYDGDVQRKMMYDYLPNALQKFATYRGLRYPGNTVGVLWLATDENVTFGTAEIGQAYQNFAITFPLTIVLQTGINTAC